MKIVSAMPESMAYGNVPVAESQSSVNKEDNKPRVKMLGEKTKPEQPRRKIPFLKHYVPVWTMLLVVLMISGAIAVVVLNYGPITVNVGEPLRLDQSVIAYATVAGSTEAFTLSVANSANNLIPFTLSWSSEQASFLTLTANGQALSQAGLQFEIPARISLTEPGAIAISIAATTSALTGVGTITIQFTVSR